MTGSLTCTKIPGGFGRGLTESARLLADDGAGVIELSEIDVPALPRRRRQKKLLWVMKADG
jgi:hypothetical protein